MQDFECWTKGTNITGNNIINGTNNSIGAFTESQILQLLVRQTLIVMLEVITEQQLQELY
jgi:hypothetical protein